MPAKTSTTFRPAFLLDYHGDSHTPYDREFTFVGRSLGYADQVAVVDDLARWDKMNDPQKFIDESFWGGFPECNDLLWTIRRIGKYAALEEAQLLYYVQPPERTGNSKFQPQLTEDAVSELTPLVAERLGWVDWIENTPLARSQAAQELDFWFNQLAQVLEYTELFHQNIDLYLPDWFAGPQLLDWLYKNSFPPSWIQAEKLRDQQSVTQLLNLPAPSMNIVNHLSANELLRVREADQMIKWRDVFKESLSQLSRETDLASRLEINNELQVQAKELTEVQRLTSILQEGLSGSVQAGFAVAPTAVVTHKDPLSAAVEASAPLAVSIVSSFIRWLFSEDSKNSNNEVRDKDAEACSLKMFLNEPIASPNKRRVAPTSWMRTLDGKPIAFDPFEGMF